jgi:hypothetical protein
MVNVSGWPYVAVAPAARELPRVAVTTGTDTTVSGVEQSQTGVAAELHDVSISEYVAESVFGALTTTSAPPEAGSCTSTVCAGNPVATGGETVIPPESLLMFNSWLLGSKAFEAAAVFAKTLKNVALPVKLDEMATHSGAAPVLTRR